MRPKKQSLRGDFVKLSAFNVIIPTRTPGEYLLTNMLSGAVIGIDGELKSVIESGDIDKLDPDITAHLASLGVIIPVNTDEYRIFKVEYEKRKYTVHTLNFTLVTTYACNLACPYCYEGKGEILKGSLDKNTGKRITTFIKQTVERTGAKRFSIALYGGEPLLNFEKSVDVIDSCFTWAEEKGIEYTMFMLTNGTLLTPEIAETLHHYKARGVQVTLDGPQRIHDTKRVYKNGKGTYNDIIRAVQVLRDHNIFVGIRVNVDTKTKPYIGELLDELEELGLKDVPVACGIVTEFQSCLNYAPCIQEEDTRKTLFAFRSIVEKKGFALTKVERIHKPKHIYCGSLGEGVYIVDPHADVYKCLALLGSKEHCIGHINEDGHIEYTPVYYDWMSRDPLTMKECRNCKILPSCGGGCAAAAYERCKTYHVHGCYDPYSEMKEQLQWYLEKKFPESFKEGKIIWD